jgi:hypothetical protein
MLFISSHKMNVQPDGYDTTYSGNANAVSMSAACGYADPSTYPAPTSAPFGQFGYLFPDTPIPPHGETTTTALDALGDAMVDQAAPDVDNTDVPAIITYLGQFIDHDINAGTDLEQGASQVDIPDVAPLSRAKVLATVANLRTGALDLDSLYGGAAMQGEFAAEMTKRLRHPKFPAKLRLGTDVPIAASGPRPARPVSQSEDPAHDLLRAERLVKDEDPLFTPEKIKSLPPDLRKFLTDNETGELNLSRAVIGDGRNDENLAVATVHLAFARLHNRIVDHAPSGSADERYNWARTRVRWIYQWLLVNVYLPSVCHGPTLARIVDGEAPLYKRFLERVGSDGKRMPMPLEFSVAAFRFGHSTARAEYDWNANFGRSDPGGASIIDRAPFQLMFSFTGNGRMNEGPSLRLPSGWIVDTPRFLNAGPIQHADRNTRLIDTHIAPPLHMMQNEVDGVHDVLKRLPRRNLRRGQRLALPTAQSCIAALAAGGEAIEALSSDQLTAGDIGETLVQGGFVEHTPLWFYVLKEAEVLCDGMRLGPLGTHLVAQTLVGLVVHGPNTYFHEAGSDDGRWHPQDDVQPAGEPVDSLPALMRAALMA